MKEILSEVDLITPVFTLLGVMIGTILSFITSWLLKSRETKLKISTQLIEKRIEAHEKVLILAKSMRATFSLDKVNAESEYITYPLIFHNKTNYQDWRNNFFFITNEHSHWLGRDILRELFYIQDYIVNLDKRINKLPEENYISIGVILKADFVYMAENLEKNVVDYFERGWKTLKIQSKRSGIKLPRKESISRLNNSNLFKRHLEIYRYLNKGEKAIPRSEIKKEIELFNIAPNGSKIDIVYIKEIPNVDNSGVDYQLFFKECEYYGEIIRFGKCDLILGNIYFDNVDDGGRYLGVSHSALSLLTKWIKENLEDIEFKNETIEYD